jgi:hypothetical protein
MRLKVVQLAVAVGLASGATAFAALSADSDRDTGGVRAPSAADGPDLIARGKLEGLYPGAVERLRVHVRNTTGRPVKLSWVRTKVLDASPECSRRNLEVRHRRRPRRPHPWIGRRHSTRTVKVRAKLLASAPDACQGARWPLRFALRERRPR